ncbi:hypothetical protein Tco_0370436 [Tanacetum coccineum]
MAITTAASLDAAQDNDNIIRTQTTTMPNVDIPQGMDISGSLRRQDTMRGSLAQTMSEGVLEQPIDHLSQKTKEKSQGIRKTKEVKHLTPKKEEIQTVYTLFMDGTPMEINMLVEKKYPLIKELLEKMLNLQLKAEEESTKE